MAVEERHAPTTAGNGTAVAREEGDDSSLTSSVFSIRLWWMWWMWRGSP
jgi:hypothetical protein